VKTINVIGCGKVGKTLARLWVERDVFEVRSVLNRSLKSSAEAVRFVGGGRAIERYAQLERADLLMISASDEAIGACCRGACGTAAVDEGVVVFHVSGSLPSALLAPARSEGAAIASVHPVKSFADPAAAVRSFEGTFCAMEGDPQACDVLHHALQSCGGVTFRINPEFKTIYHAATVMVSNYLVALMETGLRCLEKAGIARETGVEIIKPIVAETVDNVFRLGPVGAITGPVARGEPSVVRRQCEALGRWDTALERVYRSLGQVAVQIAALQGRAAPDALASIREILGD
jgi:predicted short-subunit dehydrogenase-like oxidoreductase (DUF2520 family)